MSGTVKTVLIVGGAIVGGYILVRALSPSGASGTGIGPGSLANVKSQQQSVFLGGLLSGFFGGLNSSSPVSTSGATASWNNVSTSQLDILAAQDAAAGVEGPY